MQHKRASIFIAMLGIVVLFFCSCPTPVPTTNGTPLVVPPLPPVFSAPEVTPYISILDNKIFYTTLTQEYSLNNQASWTDCSAGTTVVTFATGNKVWVREKSDTAKIWYLGEVKAVSGMPDLFPSERITLTQNNNGSWSESDSFIPGQGVRVFYKIKNLSPTASSASCKVKIYLSSDTRITDADTLIYAEDCPSSLAEGTNPADYNDFFASPDDLTSVQIPANLAPGTYFLGYRLDTENSVSELNDDNNTTLPSMVKRVFIKDTGINTQGAIKVVNSWGRDGNWENKKDGHYWMTYETLKTLQIPIFYYYNDFSVQYRPTIIAVFKLSNPSRAKCLVKFYIGNASNPFMVKEFNARVNSSILSGNQPFPNDSMALDISEFAYLINDYNVTMSIETAADATSGTVDSFSLKCYSAQTSELVRTIAGSTGAFSGSGATTAFTASSAGAFSAGDIGSILPPARSRSPATTLSETFPSSAELLSDMRALGVYEPGKNYNILAFGKYGTGFAPPTLEEWAQLKKLRAVASPAVRAIGSNQKIDLSKTKYFPPIGNQGSEGSCTCFASGYYVHTYTMAKEFNWDLTGVTWGGTWPGAPQSNKHHIMSPEFIYHQINSGADNGSSPIAAFGLLSRMGAATWDTMPYSDQDHTTWPSEAAFMEAALYRGSEVFRANGYLHYGYFIIRNDSDINLLKQLLLNGFMLTTSIDATDANSVYAFLSSEDVSVIPSVPSGYSTDHAQTIVGFKDGSAWDINNPDD